jgi:hypothetical protein
MSSKYLGKAMAAILKKLWDIMMAIQLRHLWNYAQHFAISDNFFESTFGPTLLGHINLNSLCFIHKLLWNS